MNYRAILPFVAIALLAGCSQTNPPPQAEQQGKLPVAASFYPLAFLSEEIGGNLVSVTQVTPGGVEPHDYEPSPQELASVHDAKVFLMNGEGVDGWADKIIDELRQSGVVTVRMTDSITPMDGFEETEEHEEGEHEEDEHEEGHEEEHGGSDPHIWLNPVLVKKQVELIRDAFIGADAAHADTYRQNADRLLSALSALDADYRAGLARCDLKQVVTSHNAFRYMAKEYGFETLAISGISPDEEPSSQRISELADFARANGVKYIFFETLVSPKLAETVADEIGAQALVLNPIEGLTPDDVAGGETYLTIMKKNLQNLRTAMQCQ